MLLAGPALLIFVLPAVVYGLFLACNQQDCLSTWPQLHVPASLTSLSLPPSLTFFRCRTCGVGVGGWNWVGG